MCAVEIISQLFIVLNIVFYYKGAISGVFVVYFQAFSIAI